MPWISSVESPEIAAARCSETQVLAEVDAGYLGAQGRAEPGDRQASAVDSRWFGKSRVPKIHRGSSLGDTRE